jgi:hypothetical protein
VSLKLDPKRNRCSHPITPKVRAILSWSAIPSSNPNTPPVWGNVLDGHIQIKPRQHHLIDIVDIIGQAANLKLELPKDFVPVELQPIPLPEPGPLPLSALLKRYSASDKAAKRPSVEPHRFGFSELHAAITQTVSSNITAKLVEWNDLGLNWPGAIGELAKTKGDVSYEQLDCLALDTNLERLVATFTVKRPNGYSGGLCEKGSQEYVAFWADWDNKCDWVYLGTANINVHDISSIPAGGLHYAAILPVNLQGHRRSCKEPKVARVRAVLSWNSPPSKSDADQVPHWGNRLDAHVQIKPGINSLQAHIRSLGGVPKEDIHTASSGLTQAGAKFWFNDAVVDGLNRECPFGGEVLIHGQWFLGNKYRITVRETGNPSTESVLTDPFDVLRWAPGSDTQNADSNGFFTYLNPSNYIESNLLARWNTVPLKNNNALWEVQLELADFGNVILGTTGWLKLQLDNTAPTAHIYITAGACKQFPVKTAINGLFSANDAYFGGYSIQITPFSQPSNPTSPSSGNSAAFNQGWSLDTKLPIQMNPCAYVVTLHVVDRTVVNSAPGVHHYTLDDVSFSLV